MTRARTRLLRRLLQRTLSSERGGGGIGVVRVYLCVRACVRACLLVLAFMFFARVCVRPLAFAKLLQHATLPHSNRYETWFYWTGIDQWSEFVVKRFADVPFPDDLKGHSTHPVRSARAGSTLHFLRAHSLHFLRAHSLFNCCALFE